MNRCGPIGAFVAGYAVFHLLVVAAAAYDWGAVDRGWDEYCMNEDHETSALLLAGLPQGRIAVEDRPSTATVRHLYSGLSCLAPRLIAGDEDSVHIGFRLLLFADAAFGEDLSVLLGHVATTHPALFLRVLQQERVRFDREHDPMWVTAVFDSDQAAQEISLEQQRRISSLKAVDDPSLASVRDAALAVLAGSLH